MVLPHFHAQNLQYSIKPDAQQSLANRSALYFGVSDEFCMQACRHLGWPLWHVCFVWEGCRPSVAFLSHKLHLPVKTETSLACSLLTNDIS